MREIKPPLEDVYVGLECYKSGHPGVGGTIKQHPEDFIVQEITPEGKLLELESDEPGDTVFGNYTHFTLVKRDWETMRAVCEVAKRLGVSRNRLSFAGTKDKKAVTAQRVAGYKIAPDKLAKVSVKDIRLKDVGYSDENLGLGCLWGNKFTIRIRHVGKDATEAADEITRELLGGFPNFYGRQRFGEARPITHEVGKHILKGDFEGAVMCYLGRTFGVEDHDVEAVRRGLLEERNFKAVVDSLPKSLGYERAIINHLIEKDGDWIGALGVLPKNLKKMFVHAYQSHLYNRALSRCMMQDISVERLPLAGYEVEADPITRTLMEEDGIEAENFRVGGLEDYKSRGEYRDCFKQVYEFTRRMEEDYLTLEFKLEKGAYATVLLREYMKN